MTTLSNISGLKARLEFVFIISNIQARVSGHVVPLVVKKQVLEDEIKCKGTCTIEIDSPG